MNVKIIKERLVDIPSDIFTSNGFKYHKVSNQYIRDVNGFKQIFHIILHTRRDHYAFECYAFIGWILIEKITNDILKTKYPPITIGNELGALYYGPDERQVSLQKDFQELALM